MYTALHPATINNRTDAIKRLPHVGANYTRVPRLSIDEEADIDLKNKHNQTPLDYALERKFLK